MHMLFRLEFLAVAGLVSLIVSFFMGNNLEEKWNALIKSLDERLMRFIHRHDECLERESNRAREIEERTQKIEKAITHLLTRIKNLETPPEVRAKNSADSAVDELLNSSWEVLLKETTLLLQTEKEIGVLSQSGVMVDEPSPLKDY